MDTFSNFLRLRLRPLTLGSVQMGIGGSSGSDLQGERLPPPEPKVRHPPRKNCNRKTHKNGIYTTFWRKHSPSEPKNTDILPPPGTFTLPSRSDRAHVLRRHMLRMGLSDLVPPNHSPCRPVKLGNWPHKRPSGVLGDVRPQGPEPLEKPHFRLFSSSYVSNFLWSFRRMSTSSAHLCRQSQWKNRHLWCCSIA